MLWSTGTENSGISVFVQEDRLIVDYNAFDDHTIIVSDAPVPTGESTLRVLVRRTGPSIGSIAVEIDGRPTGQAELAFFMQMISSVGSSIGYDHGSAVSTRY